MMMEPDSGCFHRNRLFDGKPILRLGVARFIFIFVVLSSLAAIFALFLAWQQKRPCLHSKSFTTFQYTPSGKVILQQMFSLNLVIQIVRFMASF